MKRENCEIVRLELDELMLEERCSAAALSHLQECSECREFQEKQTKLRQIVGSLGTVAAPADFDFRLRARLANESNGAAFHLNWLPGLFARRSVAVASMLLLCAAIGVVVVRNLVNQPGGIEVADTANPAANPGPQVNPGPAPAPDEKATPKEVEVIAKSPKVTGGRPLPVVHRQKRNLVAEDFSNRQAELFGRTQAFNSTEAFQIDASLESFKVSLDDGRGNARTISLPTIRFGSQRMLPAGNQYAATKGVW